jgi:hypothetical protein
MIKQLNMTPIDYHNPNDNWMQTGYDPYKGMNDVDRMTAGCLQGVAVIVAVILGLLLCALLSGCTTTKYVTVPEVHEHWHHSTDTIHKTDSIIDRQTTTIREVDSATMAQYGIQLKDMQRAWLIETNRLQREISELRETHTDTVHEHDSIPYPVVVVKQVPAQLSWWQQARLHLANIMLCLLAVVAIIYVGRKYLRGK